MAFASSTDHVKRALAKLLSQFGNSPKIRALLATYVRQLQAVEQLVADMLLVSSINSGVGIYLDRIGVIVGRGRKGLLDDDYRYALRAQIRINRSCGKVADFIAVLMLSVNNDPAFVIECHDAGPACALVVLHGPAPATVIQVLWESARRVKMAGVRLEFVLSLHDDDHTFACAPAPVLSTERGPTDHNKGFAWTDGSGGYFPVEFAS